MKNLPVTKLSQNLKLLETETIDYLKQVNELIEEEVPPELKLKLLDARKKTRLDLCSLYKTTGE